MFIFDEVLDLNVVHKYKDRIDSHYKLKISQGHDPEIWYPSRNLIVSEEPVVDQIQRFLESKLRVKLTCYQAELQTWYDGVSSSLHVHDDEFRRQGDFNSLLYLNEDFEGGEFYTKDIILTPRQNRLIFFNGKTTPHGLDTVEGNNRYTLICWWKDTEFY